MDRLHSTYTLREHNVKNGIEISTSLSKCTLELILARNTILRARNMLVTSAVGKLNTCGHAYSFVKLSHLTCTINFHINGYTLIPTGRLKVEC